MLKLTCTVRSATLALTLAAGLTLPAAATLARTPLTPTPQASQAEPSKIAMIQLKGSPSEAPGPLDWLFGGDETPTLSKLVDTLEDIAEDDSVDGVLIRLKDAELSATQVQEVGVALNHIREAGKKVHVFAESYGTSDLMLASYADEVIIQEGGAVSLPGLYMEEMFLADTLAWVGLKADFVQVGDYKGAAESLARNAPSKEWDQNINQLLDSLYANVRKPILKGRKLTDKKLDEAMETAWMADAKDAARVGLIDTQVDLARIADHLDQAHEGDGVAWQQIKFEGEGVDMESSMNPFAIMSIFTKQPDLKPKRPTIAVLHIDGAIIDGDSTSGGLFGGEEQVGSRTIRNALEDILKEPLIKGVVVRINSPGGSATASEVIWQGLRRVADKKPVWVSVGHMAASGGYYCAVAGEKIYVNPSSIVGSIGVVGGKLSMQGLYDWAKVKVVGRARGPRAHMFASAAPWGEQERELVRKKMEQTYTLFTSRVEAGREGIDLSQTAEGRLFTGDRAVELKMADEVGGLDECVSDLATKLSMDNFGVMHYPAPKSLGEVIEDAFEGVSAPADLKAALAAREPALVTAARELLGDTTWRQIAPSVQALMQMREQPVILMSPRVIVVK
ncbi:MAG TPA: S49 family peptidase [Phycisphaerales bacterium]|nr:S49 family peptidase [Phycisphaerales bacterium]